MRRLTKDENAELRTEALISVETRIREFIVEAKTFILSSQLASGVDSDLGTRVFSAEPSRPLSDGALLSRRDGPESWHRHAAGIRDPHRCSASAGPAHDRWQNRRGRMSGCGEDRPFFRAEHEPPCACAHRRPYPSSGGGHRRGALCGLDLLRRHTFGDHEFRHIAPFHLLAVNSLGFLTDLVSRGFGSGDDIWDGDVESETSVGEDRWTVELLLRHDDNVKAKPPARCGASISCVLSGAPSMCNWVRTYPNGLVPDDFGILRF